MERNNERTSEASETSHASGKRLGWRCADAPMKNPMLAALSIRDATDASDRFRRHVGAKDAETRAERIRNAATYLVMGMGMGALIMRAVLFLAEGGIK